ncbi:hypothetical protein Fmac_007762 [Flemingia macrophylla]|uniref:Uncharacterized protein n=1 Tax=Flemingia macrophylla TaxID=520843 RepID=A0ABD1MVH3_9FABA
MERINSSGSLDKRSENEAVVSIPEDYRLHPTPLLCEHQGLQFGLLGNLITLSTFAAEFNAMIESSHPWRACAYAILTVPPPPPPPQKSDVLESTSEEPLFEEPSTDFGGVFSRGACSRRAQTLMDYDYNYVEFEEEIDNKVEIRGGNVGLGPQAGLPALQKKAGQNTLPNLSARFRPPSLTRQPAGLNGGPARTTRQPAKQV